MKHINCITILFFCFVFTSTFAQTHVWNGNAGDNDWHNEMNWDINLVPTASSNVIIPENLSVHIFSTNALAYIIQLNPNASLTLEKNLSFAILSITPNASFIWEEGIITGGLIENDGEIRIETPVIKDLYSTTLNNRGNILISNSNTIRIFNTTTINNTVSGEIIIDSNGGIIEQSGGVTTVNNNGAIRKLGGETNGTFYMIFDMNNSGIIDIGENQMFLFLVGNQNFTNLNNGVLQGSGIFDITSNFTNTGSVSPGSENSVGRLDIINFFSLDNPAQLIINIEGINSDEHDLVTVQGSPSLNGNINVNLNYEPNIGDTYTILTSSSSITSCDFPLQVTAAFDGYDYTFDVICNSNNIVLQVESSTLSTNEVNDISTDFHIVPNPIDERSYFVFQQNQINENTSISIYNYLGQEIKTIRSLEEITYLNASHLASGLYIAQLKNKEGILSIRRFIVP